MPVSDADLWADDIAAVTAESNLRRAVLVDWSLGGFVAGARVRRRRTRKFSRQRVGRSGDSSMTASTRLNPATLEPPRLSSTA